MNPIIPAVIIGGVVYEVSNHGAPAPFPKPSTSPQPSYGSTITQIVQGKAGATPSTAPKVTYPQGSLRAQIASAAAPFAVQKAGSWSDAFSPADHSTDPDLTKKIDAIQQACQDQYNNLDAAGKTNAADAINQQFPNMDPKLNGSEDWQTIASAAGGAAGAAGGTAACGAIPGLQALAPMCGKLGALCGAYLGAKLEDLVAKNWDDIKSWLNAKVWSVGKDALDKLNQLIPIDSGDISDAENWISSHI